MFHNLEKIFGTDGTKLYKGFIEKAKEDIPKIVEENIIVLRAMKKADLPQYMLRRVVYDNYGVSPESFGRHLRRIYANERINEYASALNSISENCRTLLWNMSPCAENITKRQAELREMIENKLRSSIDVKPFTDDVYATLRPIIDSALDEI